MDSKKKPSKPPPQRNTRAPNKQIKPSPDPKEKEVVFPKKKGEQLKLEVAHICDAEPSHETLQSTIDLGNFLDLAEHIVLRYNDKTGFVPTAADPFFPGAVAMYLAKLFACYMCKCSVNQFDVKDYNGFGSFFVPGYVGVIFHSSVKIKDRRTGGQYSTVDPNFDADIRAHEYSKGTTACPIIVDTSFAEDVFGTGGTVNYATVNFESCTQISRKIASCFPNVVCIDELAECVESYSSLISVYSESIKPISIPSACLSLIRTDVRLFPCRATLPNPYGGSQTAYALMALLEDVPYRAGFTINGMLRSIGVDPFRFTVSFHELNYAKFFDVVFTLIKRNGNIAIGTSGTVAWNIACNTAALLMTGYSAKCHWLTRTKAGTGVLPAYVTPPMRSIKLIPALVSNGLLPTLVHSAYIVPIWNFVADKQFCCWPQRSESFVASSGIAFGNLPITGTVSPTYSYAGIVPLTTGNNYNQFPLRTFDQLSSYVGSLTNLYQAQTAVLPSPTPLCPCVCSCNLSNDNFEVSVTAGAEFNYIWVSTVAINSAAPMGFYACSCAHGGGFLDGAGWSRFHKDLNNQNGEQALPLIEAGFRDANYESFAAANQRKGPSESLMSYYRSRIMEGVETVGKVVKPEDLKKVVVAMQETGFMPVEVDPNIFNNLSGEYNLPWLTAAIATAVGRYGPSVWRALQRNREVRVRQEL